MDEQGLPLPLAAVRFRSEPVPAADWPWHNTVAEPNGSAPLFLVGASAELKVEVEGFEPLLLRGVASDREVVLHRRP